MYKYIIFMCKYDFKSRRAHSGNVCLTVSHSEMFKETLNIVSSVTNVQF